MSGKAVDFAINLAGRLGSVMTILHVIDNSAYLSRAMPAAATPTHLVEPIEDYLRQGAGIFTQKIKKKCEQLEIKAKVVIRSGHPVEEILKEAKKSKAGLIVMGSRGKGAISSVLGSVTFGVLHGRSKTAVLVVR
ncbi:MAG: universal stress protein [Deltaproteobacteria bacterium]|nr:universal stress protein [Deltaproteobacteria bacterium]